MSLNLSNFSRIFSRSDQSRLIDSATLALESEFDFQIKIRKSLTARRITLRACQVTGGLRITIPPNLKTSDLRNFINKNMNWVRSNLRKLSPSVSVINGVIIPVKGKNRKILTDPNLKSSYLLKETELIIPNTKGPIQSHVKFVLKKIAEDYFRITCEHYAGMLGVKFEKISMRDPKSRWGSCSSERKLMFSWRLIMAPSEIGSYVAAHEISHLLHMNHSRKFWTVVESIYPNYCDQRDWLRENGRGLHKFVF